MAGPFGHRDAMELRSRRTHLGEIGLTGVSDRYR